MEAVAFVVGAGALAAGLAAVRTSRGAASDARAKTFDASAARLVARAPFIGMGGATTEVEHVSVTHLRDLFPEDTQTWDR